MALELNLNKPGSISSTGMQRLRETYKFVFLGIFTCIMGCIVGLPLAANISTVGWIGFIILEFAALFLFMFKKNALTYALFTLISGITLIPVISSFLGANLGYVIIQALVGTISIVGLLTVYTLTTKKDYMQFSTILFYILIGVIILSVLNIFFGNSIFSLLISAVTVVLFSFYIVVNTQEVLYTDIEPLDAAMNIYLDILNIFVSLLNILGILEKD